MEYLLYALALVLAFLGLNRLSIRKAPSAAEIEREREKALVEKAQADLEAGIKNLKNKIQEEEKDKSKEEILETWKDLLK